MPWAADSPRRARLPADWATIRAAVLERDDYHCQHVWQGNACGWRASDVDHIVRGDDHSMENLQSLCSHHHKIKSAREGNAARWTPPTAHARRPPERHPGMA
jgi:5-methylcytosine-specific restriction enzyme A